MSTRDSVKQTKQWRRKWGWLKTLNWYSGASSLGHLYSRDTSIQGTQTLVPEKGFVSFVSVTSIKGTHLFRGKPDIFCGSRNPGLTFIQGTPWHLKSDWPQKALISLSVHQSQWWQLSLQNCFTQIDVLHLWQFFIFLNKTCSLPRIHFCLVTQRPSSVAWRGKKRLGGRLIILRRKVRRKSGRKTS